ncbi:hypothetical protein DV738_g400, partial [Chaetothyriales sp. CBS 135597]
MRLRSNISPPKRFDDEFAASNMRRVNPKTVPKHPELLQRPATLVVPSSPHRRAAAFPTLPLSGPVPVPQAARNEWPLTEEVDFESISDDQESEFELYFDHDDRVSWSALELSVQCQIFSRLIIHHQPADVAVLLGLTADEHTQMRKHHLRRKQFPFVSPDAPDDSIERDTQYRWICDFVEAYPISVQRAARFLQERGLRQHLLGQWTPSPDGSGMLVCSKLKTGSMALCTPSFDSDGSPRAFEVLITSSEGQSSPHTLQPRYYLALPTRENLDDQSLSAHTEPMMQAEAFPRRRSLLSPIDLTAKPNTKRKRQRSPDPRTEERPKKAARKSRKQRPPPIKTGRPSHPPARALASIPEPGANKRRNGDEIEATEKRQEVRTDRDIEPEGKRTGADSSPSSLFVSLRITRTPKSSINQNIGHGQVARPRTADEIQGYMAALRLSTPSVPPRTPTAKSGHQVEDTELMHESDWFSSTFRRMPKDDQERLLSVHPANRTIVQTWLIYGKQAWNQKRNWNRNFPKNRHREPSRAERWDPKDGGSALCRSLVVQRNLSQELGRTDKFFENAQVGEKIVQAYEAISQQRKAIEETLSRPGVFGDKKVGEAAERCKQIERDLCDELKKTYMRRLSGPGRDLLADKFPDKVIFFDSEPGQVLVSPSSEALPLVTTPQSRRTENVFTSKALGVSLDTPRARTLVDGSNRTDPFAEDGIVDAAAEHALASSPLLRKHQLNLTATKAPSDRAGFVPGTNHTTPTRSRRSFSISRPSFSPIPEEEARQFAIEFERQKHAARLIREAEHEQEEYQNELSPGTKSANKEGTKAAPGDEPKPTKFVLKLYPFALVPASPSPTGASQSSNTELPAKKKTAKALSSSTSNTGPRKRAVETRAQKAFREDKPSAHTRSRVSTPDPSLDKVGVLKKGARVGAARSSTSKAKKTGRAIKK